jgi:two-component system sensor histidine kinase SenX3
MIGGTYHPFVVLVVLLSGVVGILAGGALVGWAVASGRILTGYAHGDVVAPARTQSSDIAEHASLSAMVIESLDLGVAVIDIDYDVRVANRAIRRFELVVGTWVDPRVVDLLSEARSTGTIQRCEFDLAPAHRSQDHRSVGITAVPLTDEGDGFVAVIVTDITDARRLEAVRRDFVANVSHELKTPVGALSLLAETLFAAADDPDAVTHFAAQVQHESARLAALISELIELSRLQGAEPLRLLEPVGVRLLLDDVMDRARITAATAGIPRVAGDPGSAAVLGSERQLSTALGNLIDNAIAYSGEGTRVVVGIRTDADLAAQPAGTRPGDPMQSSGLAEAVRGPWVEISVSDQGVGIAEGDLERVFERFYRVDPARSRATGGTGLGLAIVKHIISNHGGTISVWSVEGAGSTFTVRLPRHIPSPVVAHAIASTKGGSGRAGSAVKGTGSGRPASKSESVKSESAKSAPGKSAPQIKPAPMRPAPIRSESVVPESAAAELAVPAPQIKPAPMPPVPMTPVPEVAAPTPASATKAARSTSSPSKKAPSKKARSAELAAPAAAPAMRSKGAG